MNKLEKYRGIIPAFYACYDSCGEVSTEKAAIFTKYLVEKKVKGLYVGGSSGECIYQNPEERKRLLEAVVEAAEGKLTIIAHVACNNTRDSVDLARHAQSVGVDAIASIPPIYFHLPDYAIAKYWNDMSAAAPDTDFIIYNIPQLAGVALSLPLLRTMLDNPRVVGVKNSSMPVQDIQMFKAEGTRGGREFVVFNGPDEQLVSGLAMGADGGIGGTYAVMSELYNAIYSLVQKGNISKAREIQNKANEIIYAMCSCKGNLYAVMKEIIKIRDGIDLGGVRNPLFNLVAEDMDCVRRCKTMIDEAIASI
ncbi:MAG: dihydrodipicolinate synthase family protein [Sphaerochaetaceae bacterium]|nr:dihydrodipicolinate synthase family protein [Sphaerochaetaceae bacterium]